MAERYVREGDPYRREILLPVTLRERVAYALCARDNSGDEHRLTGEEFEGLGIVLRKIWSLAGTRGDPGSLRHTLGVPPGAVRRYYWPLLWLWRFEHESRRPEDKRQMALARAHAVAADWPNYLPAAESVLTVLAEDPERVRAELAELSLVPAPDHEGE